MNADFTPPTTTWASLRLSLGRATTVAEIDAAVAQISNAAARLTALQPEAA